MTLENDELLIEQLKGKYFYRGIKNAWPPVQLCY